jgi:hypothetical protein
LKKKNEKMASRPVLVAPRPTYTRSELSKTNLRIKYNVTNIKSKKEKLKL